MKKKVAVGVRKTSPVTQSRPFETDYAGAWKGHCLTRESALIAAMKHIVQDGYSRATITSKDTNTVVARVQLDDSRKRAVITTETQLRKIAR